MQLIMRYIKYPAPEFHNDRSYQVLISKLVAIFWTTMGEDGFPAPEQLSDRRLFDRLHVDPYLPASFAQPQRNGYTFAFVGEDCKKPHFLFDWFDEICKSFVYSAVPIDRTKAAHRSYALYSREDRIHYRVDGELPTQADPTVDNTGCRPP